MDLHVTDEIVVENLVPPGFFTRVDSRNQAQIDGMVESPTKLPWVLSPGRSALLSTEEEVYLPPDTVGFIAVRGTWVRLGIITPLTIVDPGFKGTLTIRAFNSSAFDLLITPGDSIWSMTKVKLEPKSEPLYEGRYQGQSGLTIAKAFKEECDES